MYDNFVYRAFEVIIINSNSERNLNFSKHKMHHEIGATIRLLEKVNKTCKDTLILKQSNKYLKKISLNS